MQITPARVVTFLAPIFAALSAVGTGWLSKHFPGLPHIDSTQVTALMGAGAAAAFGVVIKFLHGNSLYEREALNVAAYAGHIASAVNKVDPGVVASVDKGIDAAAQQAVDAVVDAISPAAVPPVPPAPAPVVAIVPTPPEQTPPAA